MARPFLVVAVDVEGSIFLMMMARRVGFVTVTSEFHFDSFQVGSETAARFMLGVYSLRNLVFLIARRVRPSKSPADNPGAEIRWG